VKNNKIIVAVDGPAGSGKSSISKEVAKQLGLKYIDSGAVYRSITLFLLQKYKATLESKKYIDDLTVANIKNVYLNK
jgi:cytidylate kinase